MAEFHPNYPSNMQKEFPCFNNADLQLSKQGLQFKSPSIFFFSLSLFALQTLPESAYCGILSAPPYLFESSSLLFFIVPMTIMVFLYVRMGLKVFVLYKMSI